MHGQLYTSFVFVMPFVFDTRCHAHTQLGSFHPFQGTFSLPPSNVPIKSSVLECWELGDGGKWVCSLDCVTKQKHCVIYSFGLSLLYPLHAAEMVGRIACMHANPTCYII